jgi:hypothetical protein
MRFGVYAAMMPVVAAVAIGGCGGPSGEPRVATAGGTPAASAAADVRTAYVEAMRKVVECLRAQGVKVSDPDAKGRIVFEGDNASNKKDKTFVDAQAKCREIWPTVPEELVEYPPLTPEQVEAARQYAKCMRAKGAPDFPDPRPDGYFPTDVTWAQGTPGALQAGVLCGPIVGAPASPGPGLG